MKIWLVFLVICATGISGVHPARAQLQYVFDLSIPIEQNGRQLLDPWAGGLNTVQYHQMDLNNDGVQDLVLFDRSGQHLLTYLASGEDYIYNPGYEQYFPDEVRNWMVLTDYDCDGKNDLFTSSLFGMSLYRNTTSGEFPSWELIYETIYTEGSNGQINLQVSSLDFPSITDVDGDGDTDILVFDFAIGGGIHFHQNMSVERTGACGMDLVRVTRRYGDFEECTCVDYIFGNEICPESGRISHSGGKTILSYDLSENGLQDIIMGQEYCDKTGYLPNEGSLDVALMNSVSFDFPNATDPINMQFPAVFALDIDFDGSNELIASPNAYHSDGTVDYQNSSWQYKLINDNYSLKEKNFLQSEMLDVGHMASPAFGDIDHDGDEDLMIGSGNTDKGASIYWFENVGSALNPSFKFLTDDAMSMSGANYTSIALQLIDMNNDGWVDIVAEIIELGKPITQIIWHSGNVLSPYALDDISIIPMPALGAGDNPCFFDVNNDGKQELFIGKIEGSLYYYKNLGNLENPSWELISDSYLGIEDNFRARSLHIAIGDLDNDGKSDLISYDNSLILKSYTNFLHDPVVSERLMIDTVSQDSYNHRFGMNSTPAITNLYGTTNPSIALGTFMGGINLIRNTRAEHKPSELPITMSVYPNPVVDYNTLSVIVNQEVKVRIMATTGQVLQDNLIAKKGVPLELVVGTLRAGMYILQVRNPQGQHLARQFVLIR